MTTEKAQKPEDQWWVINGDELLAALTRAHGGDLHPEPVIPPAEETR